MTVTATSVSVWWIIIFFWTQITQIQNKTTWYNLTEMLWATRHIVIALHPKLCGLVGLGPHLGYEYWINNPLQEQHDAQNSYIVLNPIYTWSSIFLPPTWSSECLFEKIRQFRPVRYRVGARLVRWCRGKSTIYLRAVVTYFVLWSWARKRCKFSFDFLSCEESYYIALAYILKAKKFAEPLLQ